MTFYIKKIKNTDYYCPLVYSAAESTKPIDIFGDYEDDAPEMVFITEIEETVIKSTKKYTIDVIKSYCETLEYYYRRFDSPFEVEHFLTSILAFDLSFEIIQLNSKELLVLLLLNKKIQLNETIVNISFDLTNCDKFMIGVKYNLLMEFWEGLNNDSILRSTISFFSIYYNYLNGLPVGPLKVIDELRFGMTSFKSNNFSKDDLEFDYYFGIESSIEKELHFGKSMRKIKELFNSTYIEDFFDVAEVKFTTNSYTNIGGINVHFIILNGYLIDAVAEHKKHDIKFYYWKLYLKMEDKEFLRKVLNIILCERYKDKIFN